MAGGDLASARRPSGVRNALAFGASLVGVGEALRRRVPGIAQGCVAAGVAVVFAALYAAVDILTPNESEAAALVGFPLDDPDAITRASQTLLNRGARSVIVKLGSLVRSTSVPFKKPIPSATTSEMGIAMYNDRPAPP